MQLDKAESRQMIWRMHSASLDAMHPSVSRIIILIHRPFPFSMDLRIKSVGMKLQLESSQPTIIDCVIAGTLGDDSGYDSGEGEV